MFADNSRAGSYAHGRAVNLILASGTGQDAVHVTIVLTGGDRGLSGDVALDSIVAIRQSLQKDGDQRTPIINFTKEEELASDVSFESGPSL